MLEFWIVIIVILVILWMSSLKVVRQFERGVVLTLGKHTSTKEPGLRFLIPGIQTMRMVDVRSTPVDVPKQEIITRDNVTVNVDAVVYLRVINASKAILETTDYIYATSQFAQAALRDVTGNMELDEILSKRDEISQKIKEIVDNETDKWGIDVEIVKIQNIELPHDMNRAMAKQAEAERERRAVIISAEGEKAAADQVAEAAEVLSRTPNGINIRTLQTLEKIAVEPSQKILVLLPGNTNNGAVIDSIVASEIKK